MKFKNKIGNLIEIDWANDLQDLQPDNVKVPINLNYLKESILKHGFALPFAVWDDNGKYYCIDGHTRKQILLELIADGIQVPTTLKAFEILAKNRTEAIKILVEVYNQKHNPFAEEILTEWLQAEEINAQDINFKSVDIDTMKETEGYYTSKIESPIYEPSKETPSLLELYDTSKTDELISEIKIKNIPDEIKAFLMASAQRFIKFRYDKIADFYASADAQTQEIMEKMALVIIDYNKAIENGFVKLSEEITEQYLKDYQNE